MRSISGKEHDSHIEASDKIIDDALSKVCDEVTFVAFVGVLAQDWEGDNSKSRKFDVSPYGPSINGWENGTIGAFLEAANAAGIDSLDETKGNELGVAAVWKRAALILARGKTYE